MADARIRVRGESTEREGARERQHGPRIGRSPQRLEDDDRDERSDERRVHDRTGPLVRPRHERLDGEQHRRRHENDREREEHDVPARRVTRREELGVAAEQVEERLCEGERAQRAEMKRPKKAQSARTSFTCAVPFGSVIQTT